MFGNRTSDVAAGWGLGILTAVAAIALVACSSPDSTAQEASRESRQEILERAGISGNNTASNDPDYASMSTSSNSTPNYAHGGSASASGGVSYQRVSTQNGTVGILTLYSKNVVCVDKSPGREDVPYSCTSY